MPFLRPYNGPTKLVLAFDIGTTFSGISYCILENGQIPEVLGITRFPGLLQDHDAKVPSVLYYDKNGRAAAAGYEALSEVVTDLALTNEWTRAEWWKLHLRPKHMASSINRDDLPPLPPKKSAVDILADFLKYLSQCAEDYIQTHYPTLPRSTIDSAEYAFTHPNGWELAQQQLYYRAIETAGLVPNTPEGRSRVYMLTEGEASLHYCVAELLSSYILNQSAPRGVAIIDAGGGTIDLSMFATTFYPASCEEIAPAECRLQGSVFVTRRAKALVERKLRGWERFDSEDIAIIAREFDETTKLVIKSDQEPAYIRVAGRRYNNSKYNISFGKLKLTGEEATSLFDESFNAIISAFEQQRKSATIPITMVFFVGGFATNEWLWLRVESYFKDRNIDCFRPDSYINKTVANGAVLSHIDRSNHRVSIRVASATYGVVCSIPAKETDPEHVRRKQAWVKDPSGKYYVPGYFKPTLRKGAPVRQDMEFRFRFSLTESKTTDFGTQVVRLVRYGGTLSNPQWVDQDPPNFSKFCTVRADLDEPVKGLVPENDCYHLDYDVIVSFGLTELRAELSWKTKDDVERRTPATVVYED